MPNPAPAPPGSTIEQRLKALESAIMQVGKVAAGALQIGPHQRSSVPGEIIAGRITTPLPAGQPQMVIDLIRSGAGSGPLARVNDGTRDRFSWGNLAAYTDPGGYTSAAGYGARLLDVNGNLLWDAAGSQRLLVLSNVATSGGFVGGIVSGSWTTVASQAITLSRKTDVFVWGNMAWNRTAGVTGDTFFAELQKDSDADHSTFDTISDGGFIYAGAPNDVLTRTFFLFTTYVGLAAGAHTLRLKATTTGDTFQADGSISIVAIGGVVGG